MAETELITGVTGFVGSHLARYCHEQDAGRIVGVHRSDSDRSRVGDIKRHVDFFTADLRNKESLEKIIKRTEPDRVFHLGAVSHVPRSVEKPRRTYQVNFTGTLNLLEALSGMNKSPSVLLAGSATEYGATARSETPLKEDHPLRPENPYGVSKGAMDLLGEQWAHKTDWKVVRTRSFPHTGPGQRERFFCSSLAKQIVEIERGERERLKVGNLDLARDYLDVRDVVKAYWALLNDEVPSGVYNVCRGAPISLENIVSMLKDSSSSSIDVKVDPERERPGEIKTIVGDSSRLKNEVNWSPQIGIEQTLSDLLTYWRDRL